jgi:small subunit ribosomal protein S13
MIRLWGTLLPNNKTIFSSLLLVYGLGNSRVIKILSTLKIKPHTRVSSLNDVDLSRILDYVKKNNFILEGDLKNIKRKNIERLLKINSYRGYRIKKGLPSRGQRTRTNSRTCRKKIQ